MEHGEQPSFSGTVLQKLLLTLLPLGIVLYLLFKGADADLHLTIGFVAGFIVYLVTFLDLTLGLAILIACVGLSPEVTLLGVQNIRLEDFVVPALLLSWITRLMQQRIPLAPLLVSPALPLYGSAILIATLLGVAGGTTKFSTAVLYMGKFTEFFLIYLLFVNNITRREEFRALAVFTLLVAVASVLTVSNAYLDDQSTGRLNGPLGETANIYGGYLILNLAIAVGLFLQSPTTGIRVGFAGTMVVLGMALLYTHSRTSIVAILFASLLFGVVKDRRLLIVTVIAGLITPAIAPASIMERISTIGGMATGNEPISWVSRYVAWQTLGGKALSESPLFGFGLASTPLGMLDNEYARVLVDTGIVGLGLFLWVLARLGIRATSLVDRLRPQTFERGYASGYWIAFVAIAVHAIGATSYTSIRTMEIFVVITGLFGALHNRCEEWGSTRTSTPAGGTILIDASPVLEPQAAARTR